MKKYFLLVAALLACFALNGQSFQEGFFLNGYTLGYRYNPAISNEGDVIGIAQYNGLSRNNVGASSFLYPTAGGEIVTALHESISADTFLGSLKEDNFTNGALDFSIFSHGWRKAEGYHTLEANLRGYYGASVPIELFQMLKLGSSQAPYDLGGMRLDGQAYAEFAYGYSHRILPWLSIGARAKLLVGIESFGAGFSRLDLSMSEELYRLDMEMDLDLTSTGGKIRQDSEGYLNFRDVSAKDKWKLPAGGGLAFDLGVVITPVEGLTLSLSALDLGAICWYYGNAGKAVSSLTFEGVTDLSYDEIKNGDLSRELNKLKDDALECFKFKPAGNKTRLEMVPFSLNAAIKYDLPFYKALSVGCLGTYHGRGSMSYKEFRGVLAWNPLRAVGITGSIGTGDYGMVWGAAISVAIKKFHLNAGLENGFGGYIPYTSTPLKASSKLLSLGITYDI